VELTSSGQTKEDHWYSGPCIQVMTSDDKILVN